MAKILKLAVLISGTGRSLHNILNRIKSETLSAEVSLVVASTPTAKGLQYAEMESIPIRIIERPSYPSIEHFSDDVFAACREKSVDYVIMAGYLKHLRIPDDFNLRVLNIHPSLTPAFCGRGMYGNNVHAKVLEYGTKISGCTVHFVNQDYDNGPVILQRAVEVFANDTPDMLNDRVFAQECNAYPEAIQMLAEERITVNGRIVHIAKPKSDTNDDEDGFSST